MIRSSLVSTTRTIPASVSPAYIAASAETNYENIENKPTINGVVLEGDMSLKDFGFVEVATSEIDELFD